MQFREQVEQLLNCKIKGICARDTLVTKFLTERADNMDDLFRSKIHDDDFILKLLEILNE